MPMSRTLHFTLVTSVTVLILAGCSGAGQQNGAVPAQTQSQESAVRQNVSPTALAASLASKIPMKPADLVIGEGKGNAKTSVGLYVTQALERFVNEYALPNNENSPAMCADRIPRGAVSVAVSAKHTLYVPVEHFIGGFEKFPIYTFGPNCATQGHTLVESFGYPTDVAIDNKNGRVYVSWYALYGSTSGLIEYDKGAIYPTRLLNDSANFSEGGLAVDSSGNVFQSVGAGVLEFPGGRQNGSAVLDLQGVSYAFGLEIDRNNNLIVSDTGNGDIDVYAPPYNAAPTLTIPTKGSTFFVKLDAANSNLYASDFTNGSVDVYAYPSCTYEYSITNGLMQTEYVYGVAVDPPTAN
jgi:hypothetical protein